MNTQGLNLDGGSLNSEYRRISDKAEIACEISQRERIARNAGRRESDMKVEILTEKCRILTEQLGKALAMVKGQSFTEQDLNTLEVGYREVGIHE